MLNLWHCLFQSRHLCRGPVLFAVPVNAPLWLNLGDAGILHVLEPQVFVEMSLVDAHGHRHIAVAVQGSMSSAGKPLATPPKVMMGG